MGSPLAERGKEFFRKGRSTFRVKKTDTDGNVIVSCVKSCLRAIHEASDSKVMVKVGRDEGSSQEPVPVNMFINKIKTFLENKISVKFYM
jgi:hypothetical protein